jgi:hypothetical protein
VQELAGLNWTDYNVHDPGVTILEAVCYAMTDLTYRADFPVADLLTNEQGVIDWELQGMLPPEIAFPCRATTTQDYRALIRDSVLEAENVLVQTDVEEGKTAVGLYRIGLRLMAGVDASKHEEVREKVRRVFAANRNLCEDLDSESEQGAAIGVTEPPGQSVAILPETELTLRARVDVREGADAAGVLAEIYFACGMKIAAGVQFESFDRALNGALSPEEVFRGPFTGYGRIVEDKGKSLSDFPPSEAFRVISSITDVESVQIYSPETIAPAEKGSVLRLHVPQPGEVIGIQVFSGGRQIPVSPHGIQMRYEQLHFANRVLTYAPDKIPSILPRPEGRMRDITGYLSIQHHFPVIYGMGPHGMPESATPERKARAQQLKAYLLFFDQHMTDYLAMLSNLRNLFSTAKDDPRQPTYFFQTLEEDNFPGIADIYPRQYAKSTLRKLLKVHNNRDRTKRILDYFLALYGETFRDDVLRTSEPGTSHEEDVTVLLARSTYLRDIAAVTRDRAAAADYSLQPGDRNNRSGLERRLSHLLGLELDYQASGEGVRLIEHILLRPRKSNHFKDLEVDSNFYPFRITVLIPKWPDRCKKENFRKFAEETVRSNCPAHIYCDIYWVTRQDMYRFDEFHWEWWKYRGKEAPGPSSQVDAAARELVQHLLSEALHAPQQVLNDLLGFDGEDQGQEGADGTHGEGVRLVDHSRLRPRSIGQFHDLEVPEYFYSDRFSVAIPAWPERFHTEKSRQSAEDTVRAHWPAHIRCDIYWLAASEMHRFERLQRNWLTHLTQAGYQPSEKVDAAAHDLIKLLMWKWPHAMERRLSHLLRFEPDRHSHGERVRLVEHSLLHLPAAEQDHDTDLKDFYQSDFSVLIPGWPDRCQTVKFRRAAESVVLSNCPRDTRCDIWWLSQDDMARFDQLNEHWWKCREQTGADSQAQTDAAAHGIIRFLRDCRWAND